MSTRRWPKRFLYSAATRADTVFIQACHLQEPLQPGDTLLLFRCIVCCDGMNYNPNKRAFSINLEKKLKFF